MIDTTKSHKFSDEVKALIKLYDLDLFPVQNATVENCKHLLGTTRYVLVKHGIELGGIVGVDLSKGWENLPIKVEIGGPFKGAAINLPLNHIFEEGVDIETIKTNICNRLVARLQRAIETVEDEL